WRASTGLRKPHPSPDLALLGISGGLSSQSYDPLLSDCRARSARGIAYVARASTDGVASTHLPGGLSVALLLGSARRSLPVSHDLGPLNCCRSGTLVPTRAIFDRD